MIIYNEGEFFSQELTGEALFLGNLGLELEVENILKKELVKYIQN